MLQREHGTANLDPKKRRTRALLCGLAPWREKYFRMGLTDRIMPNPRQCGGRPCIRGTRIRVSDVLALLASGMTPQQIFKELPDLEREDVYAHLRFDELSTVQ